MSNLGLYQTMTTLAKKVGGPKNLILIVAGVGYLILRTGEAVSKKLFKKVKNKISGKRKMSGYTEIIFEVTSDGEDSSGLTFHVGDKYKVLESDDDSILIEKFGDANNPYFLSRDFLISISNFN